MSGNAQFASNPASAVDAPIASLFRLNALGGAPLTRVVGRKPNDMSDPQTKWLIVGTLVIAFAVAELVLGQVLGFGIKPIDRLCRRLPRRKCRSAWQRCFS